MMCKWGTTKKVKLHRRYRDSCYADVDSCIANLVRALNRSGIMTIASCCGHNKRPSNIVLEDGREMFIVKNYKQARELDELFPSLESIITEGQADNGL